MRVKSRRIEHLASNVIFFFYFACALIRPRHHLHSQSSSSKPRDGQFALLGLLLLTITAAEDESTYIKATVFDLYFYISVDKVCNRILHKRDA